MKKLIPILFLFASVGCFAQPRPQYIPKIQSDEVKILGAGPVTNPGYFIWHGDTIDFAMLQDSTIVFRGDSTTIFITLTQMMDSLASLPGGHSPVMLGSTATAAGMTLTDQQLNYQSATTARPGYMTAANFIAFYNKLTTVSHNETLTGYGTAASPLKADTAIMAARIWVLNQDYITRIALDYDSLANQPAIPVIESNAYDASWDGDLDGTNKNTIYDKIQSLAGGHDPLTLSDSALVAGLILDGQELDFQRADASVNGFLGSYDWIRFDAYKDTLAIHLDTLQSHNERINTTLDSLAIHLDTLQVHNTRLLLAEKDTSSINEGILGVGSSMVDNSVLLISNTSTAYGTLITGGDGIDVTATYQTNGGQIIISPDTVNLIATKHDLIDTLFTTIAISDETTALTVGAAKRTFRMPIGCKLVKVRANVATAPTGASLIFDIKESGTTVLSTLLIIDATKDTSEDSVTQPVISDSSIADDAEMTIDITQVGSTVAGAGAKVTLYYVKN